VKNDQYWDNGDNDQDDPFLDEVEDNTNQGSARFDNEIKLSARRRIERLQEERALKEMLYELDDEYAF